MNITAACQQKESEAMASCAADLTMFDGMYDSCGGSSGSPVWSNNDKQVVAVNQGQLSAANVAVRIRKSAKEPADYKECSPAGGGVDIDCLIKGLEQCEKDPTCRGTNSLLALQPST